RLRLQRAKRDAGSVRFERPANRRRRGDRPAARYSTRGDGTQCRRARMGAVCRRDSGHVRWPSAARRGWLSLRGGGGDGGGGDGGGGGLGDKVLTIDRRNEPDSRALQLAGWPKGRS